MSNTATITKTKARINNPEAMDSSTVFEGLLDLARDFRRRIPLRRPPISPDQADRDATQETSKERMDDESVDVKKEPVIRDS